MYPDATTLGSAITVSMYLLALAMITPLEFGARIQMESGFAWLSYKDMKALSGAWNGNHDQEIADSLDS
jgi:hypothetical protein